MQTPHPTHTTWHITFGTYGTHLHGAAVPTVDKQHNKPGTPFLAPDAERYSRVQQRMKFPAVLLIDEQQLFIESTLPTICYRGGWHYRIAAAQRDHIHLLCDIPTEIHAQKVRRLVKRWLGQSLSKPWPLAQGARWWATKGSNKPIHDASYLNNAYHYIHRQRTTPNISQ